MTANENIEWYNGYPVFIATKTCQRRKHRKKRINKKWLKRYGVYEYNMMAHNTFMFDERDKVIWMTKRTFQLLTDGLTPIVGRACNKEGVREWQVLGNILFKI